MMITTYNQKMINDIGLYIHIPFCIKKCNYCAFTSFSDSSDELKERYVDKLVEEIESHAKDLEEKQVKWIYIGGGTPNTLSINQISKIINVLPKTYEELSIELNPGLRQGFGRQAKIDNVGAQDFAPLRELGFNRLSIGVQSFDDNDLQLLGRIHNSEQAKRFLQSVNEVGFDNFNVDLMIGLPNQSPETVLSNIEVAASSNPTHISVYMLSVDEGTQFEKLYKTGSLKIPCDDEYEKLYFSAVAKLESLGYKQYEISNFAKASLDKSKFTKASSDDSKFSKSGFECKYNLNTWRNGEYIGCGLSAGSFINKKRFDNTDDLGEYLESKDSSVALSSEVNDLSNFETKVLLGLRLREGVNISKELSYLPVDYKKQFNIKLENLINHELLERKGEILIIPDNKILLLDSIIENLLV